MHLRTILFNRFVAIYNDPKKKKKAKPFKKKKEKDPDHRHDTSLMVTCIDQNQEGVQYKAIVIRNDRL